MADLIEDGMLEPNYVANRYSQYFCHHHFFHRPLQSDRNASKQQEINFLFRILSLHHLHHMHVMG